MTWFSHLFKKKKKKKGYYILQHRVSWELGEMIYVTSQQMLSKCYHLWWCGVDDDDNPTHSSCSINYSYCFLFFKFYFIFKLYNIVLVLPNIEMNPPQVYLCSPSWTLLPPSSPYHPSGSSQCTSPKHPVSCIKPGLATHFISVLLNLKKIG